MSQLVNAAGIDFHAASGLIFWSDVNKDAIFKVHKNGSERGLVVKGYFLILYCFLWLVNQMSTELMTLDTRH